MEATSRKKPVVSETPPPDLDVEAVDTEAPKDEWGFPSVAGPLSECGGARAQHEEVDQLGQPTGLINELLKVDLVEA